LTDKHWKELNTAYIANVGGKLAGICSITKLDNWYKLGPFIVLEKYQGKGIGKMLLKKIVQDNEKNNLFIGSRNPAVWKIAKNLGFKEELNFWNLASDIKSYLIRNLLWSIDLEFMKELFRKRSVNQGKYRFFLHISFSQI
jgi:GNAT superfamily N-acetyltransferase